MGQGIKELGFWQGGYAMPKKALGATVAIPRVKLREYYPANGIRTRLATSFSSKIFMD